MIRLTVTSVTNDNDDVLEESVVTHPIQRGG